MARSLWFDQIFDKIQRARYQQPYKTPQSPTHQHKGSLQHAGRSIPRPINTRATTIAPHAVCTTRTVGTSASVLHDVLGIRRVSCCKCSAQTACIYLYVSYSSCTRKAEMPPAYLTEQLAHKCSIIPRTDCCSRGGIAACHCPFQISAAAAAVATAETVVQTTLNVAGYDGTNS